VPCIADAEKPAPVTAPVPVIAEFPVFFNVTDKVDAVFRLTLPKDKLEGVTDKEEPELATGYKFKVKVRGELTPAKL
jgi:hypothetical protein